MDEYNELFGLVDDHLHEYENGRIAISAALSFQCPKPSSRSATTSSPNTCVAARNDCGDIGNFIVDLEWRAKNIDRKSIEAHATDGDCIFSLVVEKELRQWRKDDDFGATIDDFQRKESEYGSVLTKKTKSDDEVLIQPARWSTMAVDACDITKGIKVARRGLRGVKLVVSDAHEGTKATVAKVLNATWQRCRVHFMRNALAHAGKSA